MLVAKDTMGLMEKALLSCPRRRRAWLDEQMHKAMPM
jgi:hypothetical protein